MAVTRRVYPVEVWKVSERWGSVRAADFSKCCCGPWLSI